MVIVPIFLEGSGTAVPRVQSGAVKALGVTGGNRIDALPGVATINEYKPGLDEDGIIGSTWHGFFVRRGTPAPMIATLNRQMAKVAQDRETGKQLAEFAAVGGRHQRRGARCGDCQGLRILRHHRPQLEDRDLSPRLRCWRGRWPPRVLAAPPPGD